MKLRRLVSAGFVVTSFVLAGKSALAAPAPACTPATMLPVVTQVPANFPGFAYDAPNATTTDVQLYDTSSGKTSIEVTIGAPSGGLVKVAPKAALTIGHSYELDYNAFCNYGAPPMGGLNFTVVAAQPLPTMLGTISGKPTATTHDYGTTQFDVVALLALADEMKPWVGIFKIGLLFDGDLVETHATTAGGSNMQVSALGWCNAKNAATQKHQLQIQAALPFATTVTSDTVELDFDCPAAMIETPTGTNPTPPAAGGTDPSGTGGTGGTATTTSTGPAHHSGCNATNAPASSSFGMIAIGLGLAAIAARRSRKQSKEGAK